MFILSGRNPYCAKLSRHSVKFPDNNNWKLSCVFVWNQSRFSGNPHNNLEGSEAVKKKNLPDIPENQANRFSNIRQLAKNTF